ncbi:MAG: hypothetical protein J6T47_06125, partial [Lachnospiraceae bacterium]|nr:hypothetical protein [Lachnospiraceae bacterium]
MTCKFCGSPLPDGAMICDLCGNNQKASKPVDAFSFGSSQPAAQKKGKPADRWNTGPSASMEGAGTEDFVQAQPKRKKVRRSFPVKKVVITLLVLALVAGAGFGAWWFINNRSVDQSEEIVESFKKVIRAKNAEYSLIGTTTAMGQKDMSSLDGGYSFLRSEKQTVIWMTGSGELFKNLLEGLPNADETGPVTITTVTTPEGAYRVLNTSERYYNLYLSKPEEFPNRKIVMVGDKCFDIETLPQTENNYAEYEELFDGDLLDQMGKEQDDPEVVAALSPEARKLYDAGKKLQKDFTDPSFIEDVLRARRTKSGGKIIYDFDADIPKLMNMIYGTIKDILPAGQTGELDQINSMTQKQYEEMGIKITGKLTIEDGYLSMAVMDFGVDPIMKISLNMQIKNPGRTDIPEDIKLMV